MSEHIHGGLTATGAFINVLIDKRLKKGMVYVRKQDYAVRHRKVCLSVDLVLDTVLPKSAN